MGKLLADLWRIDPPLENLGLSDQSDRNQKTGSLANQRRVGDSELEQVLRHLPRRGRHRSLEKLIGPENISSLEQVMILRRMLFTETELGLLDRVLQSPLLDQPLDLLSKRSVSRPFQPLRALAVP